MGQCVVQLPLDHYLYDFKCRTYDFICQLTVFCVSLLWQFAQDCCASCCDVSPDFAHIVHQYSSEVLLTSPLVWMVTTCTNSLASC